MTTRSGVAMADKPPHAGVPTAYCSDGGLEFMQL